LTPPPDLTHCELRWLPLHLHVPSECLLGNRSGHRPSSEKLHGRPWWSVHHGPCLMWSELMILVHGIFYSKINPQPKIKASFTKSPYFCHKSSHIPPIFQTAPLESKSISRYSPSHFLEIANRSLKFFSPYLCNRNSDFGDSHANILRITSSFISCIHNTCLLHID
jgi:hypothetical protein